MRTARTLHLAAVLLAGSLALCAGPALAQAWPAKPVRLISPYPPGGTNDVTGRIVAERLQARLGQPVVLENKPGANIRIATEFVARSAPDGYTLFWTAAPHTVNPALYPKLPYDTLKDFAPIAQTVMLPVLMTVPSASPAKTLREFMDLVRTRPEAGTVSSPGNGSGPHLSLELLIGASGVPFMHVPYKGDAPALNDLLGGRLGGSMAAFGTPLPHVKSGKLRALAVVSTARMPQLPEVPTFAEAGFPQVDAYAWFGLLAPAGTPPAIIERVNSEVNAVLKSAEVAERFAALGAVPMGGSPADFDRFIRADLDKWARVVRERNIKPD
jgi:tripartite-type tricarboxylate transporter receptor subunit TctC